MEKRIIKKYKKGSLQDIINRKIYEKRIFKKGYIIAETEEVKEYSGGKGCILFLIFPPLAFFGGTKYLKVTYELRP